MTAAQPPAHGQQEAEHQAGWIQPSHEQGALPRLLSALASRWWVPALAIGLTLAAAAAYLATAQKIYKAETDVLVTPVPNQTAVPGFGLILDSSDPARATETIAKLVTTPAVADRAATQLGVRASGQVLLSQIQAQPVAASNLVAITASADAPASAARLANAFGSALIDERTARLHNALDAAIRANNARIAGLKPADSAERQLLLTQATDLRTLRDAPDPSLQIASDADVPGSPASPRPLLTVAGAIIAGVILGVLGVLALEYVDPRLWREEQLAASYRLPILARIPRERSRRSGPLGPEAVSPSTAHGFRMLRANLPPSAPRPAAGPRTEPPGAHVGLLDSGRRARNGAAGGFGRTAATAGRCVMVTSAVSGEGKTTTALNLAATLVAAGERVILIDADTQHTGITDALGLPRGDVLAGLLWEHTALVDALVPVRLQTGTMYALRAEADAHDGLSDATAAALLAEAAAFADWVIVDLPPLTDSPDALPFARAAGDLLMTVRLRHTSLRELAGLAELLSQQRLVPAGFVLIGASPRSGMGHVVWASGSAPEEAPASRAADGSAAGRPVPQTPAVSS
jgi:Mrp family chromosome partitioning ATPase/capsular polysaccharide biosynthesis protein